MTLVEEIISQIRIFSDNLLSSALWKAAIIEYQNILASFWNLSLLVHNIPNHL